jgi:thiamine-monophosphate kinase
VPESEFALIRRYFEHATPPRRDVLLGVGDDCALLEPPHGQVLAVSIDTLVADVHFLRDDPPAGLGHKALAVGLSDLAAMGAQPAWATLALTLPGADDLWVRGFIQGFVELANAFGVQLIGGDTTRGPLSVTVQVHGFVPRDQALRRDMARPGDRLYVSGTLGDAALALRERLRGLAEPVLAQRLDRPIPRVGLGMRLRGLASAAIDVSDGLVSDLGHICERSGVGARVELGRLPLTSPVRDACDGGDWSLPLHGGDDYELLFSVPDERAASLEQACSEAGEIIRDIGTLTNGAGIVLVHPDGTEQAGQPDGYDHFRTTP